MLVAIMVVIITLASHYLDTWRCTNRRVLSSAWSFHRNHEVMRIDPPLRATSFDVCHH